MDLGTGFDSRVAFELLEVSMSKTSTRMGMV